MRRHGRRRHDRAARHVDAGANPRRACAPVAGIVFQVLVAVGDVVLASQPLACVEAVKLELWLHASADGSLQVLHARPGPSVAAGMLRAALEIAE